MACTVLRAPNVTPSQPRATTEKATQRAFTLVELMVVVAIVGVMSTLAIVGYRKYVYAAQSSEAKTVIQAIRGGQETYKAEMLTYLDVSTSGTYYPNTTPNDSRYAWVQPSHGDYPRWALLNVAPDAPVRFGYWVRAGVGGQLTAVSFVNSTPAMPSVAAGVPWYVVQAMNDHDHNGVFARFASASVSGEILVENETE